MARQCLAIVALLGLLTPIGGQAATFVAEREASIVEGTIEDDVYIASESVLVEARVRDDVLAAGDSVRLSGQAGDEFIAAGNRVELQESAKVSGDVFAAGPVVILSGEVDGSVYAAGARVIINETARVAGDVIVYGSDEESIEIAPGAQISGQVQKHIAKGEGSPRNVVSLYVQGVLMWFVTAVILLWLWGRSGQRFIRETISHSGKSLLAGTAWLLASLPLTLLLVMTVAALPAAGLVLLLTMAAWLAAHALAGPLLGMWLMQRMSKGGRQVMWQHALLGVFILQGVALLPVGFILVLVLDALVMGGILRFVWSKRRKVGRT